MKTVEIWKDIVGFEGYFQISNHGNVKSLERKCNAKDGAERTIKEKLLSKWIGTTGYYNVTLSVAIEGVKRRKNAKVHRLIALAFIPNPENKYCVNHIDGNKLNNEEDNLEWATSQENNQHGFDTGLIVSPRGEASGRSKLTENQVLEIRKIGNKLSQRKLALIYNVEHSIIGGILRRQSWKHI